MLGDMPKTQVVFYAELNVAPALAWLDEVDDKVRDKLFYRVRRLEEAEHELRRPEADFLRDGIHELRVRHLRVNYRLLYFFHERVGVIAHGCTKEGAVGNADIDRAIARQKKYAKSPGRCTYVAPAGT